MKRFLLIALTMSFSMALRAQSPRNVLFEDVTGAWTGWATDLPHRLAPIYNDYPELVGISYHNSDGMDNTEGDGIADFLNQTGYPSGTIDRKLFGTNSTVWEMNRALWYSHVASEYNLSAPCVLDIEMTYNHTSRELEATVSVDFTNSVTGAMRLHIFVIEDSVTGYPQDNYYYSSEGTGAGGSGHMFYNSPVIINNYSHHNVMRKALSYYLGDNGIIPNSVISGNSYSEDYSYTLPSGYDEDRISVVAFVSMFDAGGSDGNEVLNSVQKHLNSASDCNINFDYAVNGSSVVFTNNSTGAISYQWVFGDGQTSTTNSPTHIYQGNGTYTAVLRGLTQGGSVCDSAVAEFTIEVSEPCDAAFIASVNQFTTTFNNNSSGSAVSYSWDFGDGTAPSTQTNPVHLYTASGTYMVKLWAFDADGLFCDIDSQEVNISGTLICNPSFTWIREGQTVNFTNTSTGNYSQQEWSFGDGAISTSENPIYQYSEVDEYSVCLTLKDETGTSCGITCDWIDIYPTGIEENLATNRNVKIFPNPTSDIAYISFEVLVGANTTVEVYNMLGRKIETLKDEFLLPGTHQAAWNSSAHGKGIYTVLIRDENMATPTKITVQ